MVTSGALVLSHAARMRLIDVDMSEMTPAHLDPVSIRKTVLEELVLASGATAGLFYSIAESPSGGIFTSCEQVVGPDEVREEISKWVNMPLEGVPVDAVTKFEKFEVQRLVGMPSVVADVWNAVGIRASVGANVADADRTYVGWFGGFFIGCEVDEKEVRGKLKGKIDRWAKLLRRGRRLEDAFGCPGGGVAVLKPGGDIESSTSGVERWLSEPTVVEALSAEVAELQAYKLEQGSVWINGARVVVERLRPGAMFAAAIQPYGRLVTPAIFSLSRPVRLVARLAATGLSVKEIAGVVGRSVETVRTHLKLIYAELEVGGRAELTEKVAMVVGMGVERAGRENSRA